MAPIERDRFFETLYRRGATEAWLLAGKPPLIRVDDRLRALEVSPLTASEVEAFMVAVAPTGIVEQYHDEGLAEFTCAYEGVIELRATMLIQSDTCLGFFRIRPLGAPWA